MEFEKNQKCVSFVSRCRLLKRILSRETHETNGMNETHETHFSSAPGGNPGFLFSGKTRDLCGLVLLWLGGICLGLYALYYGISGAIKREIWLNWDTVYYDRKAVIIGILCSVFGAASAAFVWYMGRFLRE